MPDNELDVNGAGNDKPLADAGAEAAVASTVRAPADALTGKVWATTQEIDAGTGFGQPGHRVFGADDPTDEEDVVDDDDWDDDEPLIRTRPPLRRATLLLSALVIAGGGFLGGILTQKHHGTGRTGSGSAASAFAAAFAGRTGSSGLSGLGGGASSFFSRLGGASGGATIGQVVTTSGNTVYVETTAGSVVAVDASSATITQTVSGSVSDVAPGSEVVVAGTKEKDGTVDATTISITPTAAAPSGS